MIPLLFLACLTAGAHAAEPPVPDTLSFYSADKVVLRLTAVDLARRPSARTITIDDSVYKKRKSYRAVPLRDVLMAAYGGAWSENSLGEIIFEALDGYRSHAKTSLIMNEGGMVAFADATSAKWEEIPGRKGQTPAPFYLVWTGAKQSLKDGYPWPYQLVGLKLTVLEDEFPKALPRGAAPESAAVRGWKLFRSRCIACHAISGSGGDLGPDLNEPRGITRYRSRRQLRAFIREASTFRRTKMPDFTELTRSELNDILSYFDHMTKLAGT